MKLKELPPPSLWSPAHHSEPQRSVMHELESSNDFPVLLKAQGAGPEVVCCVSVQKRGQRTSVGGAICSSPTRQAAGLVAQLLR